MSGRSLGRLPYVPAYLRDDALSSCLNAKQVQVWLGHHSPAFTLATYVHFLDDDLPDPSFIDDVTAEGGNNGAPSPTGIPSRA